MITGVECIFKCQRCGQKWSIKLNLPAWMDVADIEKRLNEAAALAEPYPFIKNERS